MECVCPGYQYWWSSPLKWSRFRLPQGKSVIWYPQCPSSFVPWRNSMISGHGWGIKVLRISDCERSVLTETSVSPRPRPRQHRSSGAERQEPGDREASWERAFTESDGADPIMNAPQRWQAGLVLHQEKTPKQKGSGLTTQGGQHPGRTQERVTEGKMTRCAIHMYKIDKCKKVINELDLFYCNNQLCPELLCKRKMSWTAFLWRIKEKKGTGQWNYL